MRAFLLFTFLTFPLPAFPELMTRQNSTALYFYSIIEKAMI